MANLWGRNETYNWPNDKPVWTCGALAISVALVCICQWLRYENWTPLQQYWLPTYVSASFMPKLNVTTSKYRLMLITRPDKMNYLPTEDEVEPGITRIADGRQIPFVLTAQAERQGKHLVLTAPRLWSNEVVRDRLRDAVYDGHTLADLVWWSLMAGPIFLVLGLTVALPMDRERARIRKYGRRVRGPEEVTAAEFNRRNQSDGMGFITLERPTLSERILRREWRRVRIPRSLEDNHFMFMGDAGSGKSSLIRQMIAEIDERGETAIVYDPALEYTGQFYSAERGDVILNPLDQRMPYWSPSDELIRPSEALSLAASLFPDTPRDNPFFVEGPRKIFAHLLTLRPTPEELIWWLSQEDELDRKLKGTELATLIYPNAGQQRGGILASLSMVADSLKLLPPKQETARSWTAAGWSRQRRGWIFITSIPEARKQLRPLISMWLDMLVLRLMNQGKPGPRPVWFVLDELATLHHLPQLHTAITENRKSGNPVVLAFQGRSQLQTIYGHLAEAMFSQPATKIFLKTSEPDAAQWISGFIGNVEIERLRESRSTGQMPQQRETRSYQMEQEVRPLAMKEEIAGLDKGHGFLKCGNLVVRISFPYLELTKKQPDFLERPIRFGGTEPHPSGPRANASVPTGGKQDEELRSQEAKSQAPAAQQEQTRFLK
jgi:hypothetical protein